MQKEYSAKTVEEALALASKDSGIKAEDLKYQKISENGFLGLFKSVKILVSFPEEKNTSGNITINETAEAVKEEIIAETSLENVNIANEIVEACETVITKKPEACPEQVSRTAKDFVSNVLTKMGIEAIVDANTDMAEETVYVEIEGPDMGVLIGKRGQTLDSLQYLTSLVVNRTFQDVYFKVKIDTENYRARRKETLENLAKNISAKVRRTRKPVVLEPMNPYERRLIHSSLQNDKYVETHSEGEEPYRRVVVSLKKDAPRDNKYGNRNSRYNNRNSKYNNYSYNKRRNYPKHNEKSDDYSTDYKADYAAYLESKAAAKAAAGEESK